MTKESDVAGAGEHDAGGDRRPTADPPTPSRDQPPAAPATPDSERLTPEEIHAASRSIYNEGLHAIGEPALGYLVRERAFRLRAERPNAALSSNDRALAEALMSYGQHDEGCDYVESLGPCDCGFATALKLAYEVRSRGSAG